MVSHPGDLLEYAWDHPQVRPIEQPLPHFVALPTTAGTGSEVGRSSVISEDGSHVKRIIFSPKLLARARSGSVYWNCCDRFGPVIGIQRVGNDAEAVALMNDTEYGLTAGVYTPDEARARDILARVRSGSVYWNCCDRVSPRLPWSGVGHSGVGVTLSTYGIQTFTRPKAWHLRSV